MVRFSGPEAAECCVPTEKMGLPPEPAKPRWVVLRCVRTWLASSSVSVDRVLTTPSSSAAARNITSADTPSSPANLCTSITFAALSRSVVASTVTECRSTQRPGVVRSSRSLPQFTIACAGNPLRGWLLSGAGRKARPTVRGRTAEAHGYALRGAVVNRHRPQSTQPGPQIRSRRALEGLCVTAHVCTRRGFFGASRRFLRPISSLCRQSLPSDPASGNQALQHNLRLTLGSGLITAMLAVNSQIHASPLSSHPALTAPPPSSIEQGGMGNAPEVGRATAQVRDPMDEFQSLGTLHVRRRRLLTGNPPSYGVRSLGWRRARI